MPQNHSDDRFQLYDLRVEVICPPNERILCGAKPGDHFTLQGEMLRLPPDQGFSIYSLGAYRNQTESWVLTRCRRRPPAPGGQATSDASE